MTRRWGYAFTVIQITTLEAADHFTLSRVQQTSTEVMPSQSRALACAECGGDWPRRRTICRMRCSMAPGLQQHSGAAVVVL